MASECYFQAQKQHHLLGPDQLNRVAPGDGRNEDDAQRLREDTRG